ncbi:10249_t:CDS:2, partial [Ambispora gerdemannii]
MENKLPKLVKLNLANNNLKSLDFQAAPNLQELDISNNHISDVEGSKLEGNGKNLIIFRGAKNYLSKSVFNQININPKKLEELDIMNNKFQKEDAEELSRFTQLKVLSVGNGNRGGLNGKINEIGGSLYAFKNLEKLKSLDIKLIKFASGETVSSPFLPSTSEKKLRSQFSENHSIERGVYDLKKWRQESPLYADFQKERDKNAHLTRSLTQKKIISAVRQQRVKNQSQQDRENFLDL